MGSAPSNFPGVPGNIKKGKAVNRRVYRMRRDAFRCAPTPEVLSASDDSNKHAEDLEKMRQALTQAQDQCLRARSDLDNFRKRVVREREEQRKYAAEGLVRGLLDTVDNLERAIQGAAQSHDVKALEEGVTMIHQQLVGNLQRQGVEIIDANPGSAFNPAWHEAVAIEAHPDYENDQVIECLQAGYLLNDRVIRAARVKVAKK